MTPEAADVAAALAAWADRFLTDLGTAARSFVERVDDLFAELLELVELDDQAADAAGRLIDALEEFPHDAPPLHHL